MKRRLELSVTLCNALVIVLIIFESSKNVAQAILNHKEFNLDYATNGTLASPRVMMSYPKDVLWIWTIPRSQYTVIIEIIRMDLYRCYMFDKTKDCYHFDHVIISSYGPYCNWFKPEKIIVLPPWTEIKITFRSFSARDACRGYGFEANYRSVPETTTTIPATITPSYFTEDPKKGDQSEEFPLDVTIPIVIGIASAAILLTILTIWCCRKKSRTRQPSPGRNQGTRSRESRNNLLSVHIEEPQPRERPMQDQPISYTDMLRNDQDLHLVPLNPGPPPIYDDILHDNDNPNRAHDLESPPSYDIVMSESQTPETLNGANDRENDLQRNYDHQEGPSSLNIESSL